MTPAPFASDRDAAVTLREITAETVRAVCALRVAPSQEGFIAPNAVSLAEALFSPVAWFRAIYAAETPVGFLMLQEEDPAAPYLWRLTIAAEHQGKGYGRRAVALVLAHVQARSRARTLVTSCVPGDGSPCPFYRALGFVETGEIDDGEVVMRLALPSATPDGDAVMHDPGGTARAGARGTDPFGLPGVHPAPNIQTAPDVYELENRAAAPAGKIEAAMAAVAPWAGKVVLDLGAGTGYHLPRFHETAAHVIAVEPHGPSRLRAMARVAALGLERVSVTTGSAERLLLPEASVDVVHARFASFFRPGCEPGLAELARVIRPGGAAFVVDNDLRTGTFAAWLRRIPDWADADPDAIEAFWADHGFRLTRIPSAWRFERLADLEAVVRLEFPTALAAQLLAEHPGPTVDDHYALYHRRY